MRDIDDVISMFFYDTLYYFQIVDGKSIVSKFLLPDDELIAEIFSTDRMSNFLKLDLIEIDIPYILHRYCIKKKNYNKDQIFNEIAEFQIPMVLYKNKVIYPVEYNNKFLQMLFTLSI